MECRIFWTVFILLIGLEVTLSRNSTTSSTASREDDKPYRPLGPKVRCDFLPMDFLECTKLHDHKGNQTAKDKTGYGCVKVNYLFALIFARFPVICKMSCKLLQVLGVVSVGI